MTAKSIRHHSSDHDTVTSDSNTQIDGDPAALMLRRDGTICDCNANAETLFRFRRDQLLSHHISLLFPQLSAVELLQEGRPNPQLSFRSYIDQPFEAVRHDGGHFSGKIFLTDLGNANECRLRLVIRPQPEK